MHSKRRRVHPRTEDTPVEVDPGRRRSSSVWIGGRVGLLPGVEDDRLDLGVLQDRVGAAGSTEAAVLVAAEWRADHAGRAVLVDVDLAGPDLPCAVALRSCHFGNAFPCAADELDAVRDLLEDAGCASLG